MNKEELKKILKPLIKECIKEVVFEEGTLSTIIREVTKGTSNHPVMEAKKAPPELPASEDKVKKLYERKKQLLDAIGKDAYNGVNIFEGTTPMKAENTQNSPLGNVAANDPGVDISSFTAKTSKIWQKLSGN